MDQRNKRRVEKINSLLESLRANPLDPMLDLWRGLDGQDGKDADEQRIIDALTAKLPELLNLNNAQRQAMIAEVLASIRLPQDGKDGRDGVDGKDGAPGKDGRDGTDGKDGSPDTGEQVVEKINSTDKKIDKKNIEGIAEFEDFVKVNLSRRQAISGGQNNLNIKSSGTTVGRVETINFGSGSTVTPIGDGREISVTFAGGGGGHVIEDEGTPLTQRTNLNFVGTGVAVTDDAGNDATVVTITSGGGSGDVVGPASATDNAIARFDGTTGKLIQNSNATIADTTGNITAGTYNGNTIGAGSTSGTNTGDQTSIVGITGTLSEFNTALTGADFATGGGTVTGSSSGTNTGDQTITNTSDATSHTITLSASGGSVQLIEGTNITLTTGGTGSAGTVTIAASGGSGTVTATAGSLTSNAVVLGAGTTDTKVSTGITTDGTAQLNLGVNATTIGKVKMFGDTSGDVTIQPTAAAGTATVQTLPATTGTLVNRVTTGNGVSASNTDGALSFTLGAITPTTVNGHTFTSGSSTFTGTAAATYTFPTSSKTIAAADGSNIAVASQATGDLIVAASGTAIGRVADVATGQVLVSGGVGAAPAYSANPTVTTIELGGTTDTTLSRLSAGVLGVEGVAVMTNPMTTGGDIIYGGASGTPTRLANGTAGQVLQSNGTTLAPSWATVGALTDGDKGDITVSASGATWTIDANAVTFAKMQAITDGVLLGASGGTAVEEITIGSGLSLSANTLTATGGGVTLGQVNALAVGYAMP